MRRRALFAVGIVLICLGIGMLVQSLCGGNSKPANEAEPTKKTDRATPVVSSPLPTAEPIKVRPNLDIPEQVLYNEGGIIIKTDGAEFNKYRTPSVHLTFENHSDREFNIGIPRKAINRQTIYYFKSMYTDEEAKGIQLLPGGRAEYWLTLDELDRSTLMFEGSVVRDIEARFWCYEVYEESRSDMPLRFTAEIKTAAYTGTVDYEHLENRIYDKDGFTIDYVFHAEEETFEFLITNQTEDCVSWWFGDFYANGERLETLDYIFEGVVLSGCQHRVISEPGTCLNFDEISASDIETLDFIFYIRTEDRSIMFTPGPSRSDPIHIDLR